MMKPRRATGTSRRARMLALLLFFSAPLSAGTQLQIAGEPREFPAWESDYLEHAVERLYQGCQRIQEVTAGKLPRSRPNELVIETGDGSRRLIQAISGSANPFAKLALYEERDGQTRRYSDCTAAHVLPVASIIEAQQVEIRPPQRRTRAGLTSYEPNKMGWTFDDNDVGEGYLDALISLKYPLLHDGYYSSDGALFNPYLAFTGRFSQYIGSRDSSPVIGKRFNPKFFLRHWLGDDSRYIDVGYAHESNGQNINTRDAYQRARLDFALEGQDPDFARDYISRGWDYLLLDWKHAWGDFGSGLTTYARFKYFLDDGLFQGEPEETNVWEGDGEHRRKEYDGVTLLAKYRFDRRFCLSALWARDAETLDPNFCLSKIAWEHTTGYDGLFEKNTDRLELTVTLWNLPVMFWGQTGYMSDLVDYYRDVNSWGLALELQSF